QETFEAAVLRPIRTEAEETGQPGCQSQTAAQRPGRTSKGSDRATEGAPGKAAAGGVACGAFLRSAYAQKRSRNAYQRQSRTNGFGSGMRRALYPRGHYHAAFA